MRVKGIIFDLDGTLLNTIADIGDAMNRVLLKHGLPTHPAESYPYFVGDGSLKLIEKAVPDASDEQKLELLDEYLSDYDKNWNCKTQLYEGIADMLQDLKKDFTLCILSNKMDAFTKRCVNYYFPDVPFGSVLGQLEGCPRKPDPYGVHESSRATGIAIDQFIVIGDTKYDILTGKNLNLPTIAVTWGFRKRHELSPFQPDVLVDFPRQIVEALRKV